MNFFKRILKSIYGPEYYHDLFNSDLGSSFKYFFGLIALLSLVSSLIWGFGLAPMAVKFISENSQKVVNNIPAELLFRVEQGIIKTNLPQPYFINFDKKDKNLGDFEYLAVIDTNQEFSQEQFKKYNARIWVAKNSIWGMDDDGQMQGKELGPEVNFALSKNSIANFLEQVKPWFNFISPFIFVVLFFGTLMTNVFALVYLLFGALVIWLGCRIKGREIGYGKAYQLGLHALTFSLIVNAFMPFGLTSCGIPLLSEMVLLVIILINVKKPADLVKAANSQIIAK